MVIFLVLQGGVQFNVVPAQLSVGFDIRVTPTLSETDFESMLEGWCKDAGEDVVVDIQSKVSH